MYSFFHNLLTPFLAILLAAACVVLGTAAFFSVGVADSRVTSGADSRSLEQLYRDAVIDAVTVEQDELFPLVTITEDSDKVSWKDGKILLVTLNDTPELYKEGKTVVLPGESWTFTDREIQDWYSDHREGVAGWSLRLYQLIGVPPDAATPMRQPCGYRRRAGNTA